ncbi:MAG: hypothetical protein OEV49_09930 [candidate division Zixibacteria bacterium]|nr:hypothetical protein [candidate division Zixibacteria bacterium]MDH3939285.1 hypothetical protein [candidate division Zixibacteria bacterium]MDH4032340.1 hypothetical protein [candidate division Zixibacteria bacterium]
MKGSRLIAAIMLLSLALVCFISAPVLSVEDPWDVDDTGGGDDGNGSDGDSIVPPPGDSLNFEGTTSIGDGFGPDWLSGFAFQLSYEIVTYIFGGENETSDEKRVVVEESSGNVTAQ